MKRKQARCRLSLPLTSEGPAWKPLPFSRVSSLSLGHAFLCEASPDTPVPGSACSQVPASCVLIYLNNPSPFLAGGFPGLPRPLSCLSLMTACGWLSGCQYPALKVRLQSPWRPVICSRSPGCGAARPGLNLHPDPGAGTRAPGFFGTLLHRAASVFIWGPLEPHTGPGLGRCRGAGLKYPKPESAAWELGRCHVRRTTQGVPL